MTKYDKPLQSNTDEFDEATKERDPSHRERDGTARQGYDDVPPEPKDSALRDE